MTTNGPNTQAILSKNNMFNKRNSDGVILFDNTVYKKLESDSDLNKISNVALKAENLESVATENYDCVITIVDNVETKNTSMAQLLNNDYFLVLSKAGQLTTSHVSAIDLIIKEKLNACLSIIFFVK
jgi:tRNA A37 threonylcarbamoyladenosine dehydratase